MARTRLDLFYLKETKQGPESVTRFRGTGREAAVLGGLPHADGAVGSAQLDVGERVYWDDTATVIDELAHITNNNTPLYDLFLKVGNTIIKYKS